MRQHCFRLAALAVDAPLGVAVRVADGDGEAAVVGADHVDDVAGVAGDAHDGALASVGSVVGRPLWGEEECLLTPCKSYFFRVFRVY